MAIQRSWREDEIHEGLAIWALCAGNKKRVQEMLKERKCEIPMNTIISWAYNRKKDLYEQIKAQVQAIVHSRMEDGFTDLADQYMQIQRNVLNELAIRTDPELIMGMKTTDLLKVGHQAAVGADIAMDQALKLGGKPTQIVDVQFSDLKKQLKERHGISLVIEGEAVEEDVPQIEEESAA